MFIQKEKRENNSSTRTNNASLGCILFSLIGSWLQTPAISSRCQCQNVSQKTHQLSRMRLMKEREPAARVRIRCLPLSVRPSFCPSCIFWLLYAPCCLLPLVCRSSRGCGVLSGLVTTISNIRRTTGALVLVLLCIFCQRYQVHIRIASLLSSPAVEAVEKTPNNYPIERLIANQSDADNDSCSM